MAAAHVLPYEFGIEHIWPRPHVVRNVLIVAIAVFLAGIVWLMPHKITDTDNLMAELNRFRGAMFNTCKDGQFAGAPGAELTRRYYENDALRTAVSAQYHVLQRGAASCQEIRASLRRVGYSLQ